jgi:hypothetical protein
MQILLRAAVFCTPNETVVPCHFVRWPTMEIAKVSLLSCRGEECSCKIEMLVMLCVAPGGFLINKQCVDSGHSSENRVQCGSEKALML